MNNYRPSTILRGDAIRTEIPHQAPSQTQALFMNIRHAVFKECTLRQALGEMLDSKQINRTPFSNSYLCSRSYYPDSELATSGAPEGQKWPHLSSHHKQLSAQLFKQSFSLPTIEGRGISREILGHAFNLLADAGWKLSGDRLLNKKGEPLCFEILLVNLSPERILQPHRESLTSIDIDAYLRTIDCTQYKQHLDQFDYDMTLMALPQTLNPGPEQWQYFHSSQVRVKGSKNYVGIANPVIDAMSNHLLGAYNRDEQVAATHALDRILL